MGKPSIDPAAINWARRQSKRAQDSTLGAFMAPFILSKKNEKIRMLTLPAGDWAFEKHLMLVNKDPSWMIHGLESNNQVAKEMQKNAGSLVNTDGSPAVVAAYELSTTDFLTKINNTPYWDIIYFDYMGTWSRAKERDVVTMAKTARPEVFACTISLDRGHPDTNSEVGIFSQIGKRHLSWIIDKTGRHGEDPHYKITGTPEVIINLFEDNGWPMKMLGGFVYDSPSVTHPTHNTAEMTMVFQHTKK